MGEVNKGVKIRSTSYPEKPCKDFAEWADWMIKEYKRRWTDKIRQGYGVGKHRYGR